MKPRPSRYNGAILSYCYIHTLAKLKVAAAESKAKEREGEKKRGQKQEENARIVFLLAAITRGCA